jgi:hypothetical protein
MYRFGNVLHCLCTQVLIIDRKFSADCISDCAGNTNPTGIAVAGVVLGGVDSALGGDGVGAAGAVLVAEGFDVVAELPQGGGSGAAGEAGADHEDFILALIGRIDQFEIKLVTIPRCLNRSGRTFAVEYHSINPL